MIRLSPRQRMLGGALVLAAGIALVDTFWGRGTPAPAQANQSPPEASAESVPTWQEINDVIARLTREDYAPVSAQVEQLTRDLFVPTPQIEELFAQSAVPTPEEVLALEAAAATPAEPTISPEEEFVGNHRLVAVMLGNKPVAAIDSQLLPLHSELDGFRLIELYRDRAVFINCTSGARAVLELAPRGKTNPN